MIWRYVDPRVSRALAMAAAGITICEEVSGIEKEPEKQGCIDKRTEQFQAYPSPAVHAVTGTSGSCEPSDESAKSPIFVAMSLDEPPAMTATMGPSGSTVVDVDAVLEPSSVAPSRLLAVTTTVITYVPLGSKRCSGIEADASLASSTVTEDGPLTDQKYE